VHGSGFVPKRDVGSGDELLEDLYMLCVFASKRCMIRSQIEVAGMIGKAPEFMNALYHLSQV
jgi:hypothetical protein